MLRSQASATLYSIPQWQPPPLTRPETSSRGGNGPLSRPPLPDPNHSFWQDPRLRGVASTQVARPVDQRRGYRSRNVVSTHTALSTFSPIPDVQQNDKLDQRISIRPRGKTSAEVQFVLGPNSPIFPTPFSTCNVSHHPSIYGWPISSSLRGNIWVKQRRRTFGKVCWFDWTCMKVTINHGSKTSV